MVKQLPTIGFSLQLFLMIQQAQIFHTRFKGSAHRNRVDQQRIIVVVISTKSQGFPERFLSLKRDWSLEIRP